MTLSMHIPHPKYPTSTTVSSYIFKSLSKYSLHLSFKSLLIPISHLLPHRCFHLISCSLHMIHLLRHILFPLMLLMFLGSTCMCIHHEWKFAFGKNVTASLGNEEYSFIEEFLTPKESTICLVLNWREGLKLEEPYRWGPCSFMMRIIIFHFTLLVVNHYLLWSLSV